MSNAPSLNDWPFDQPRNCATFTTRQILERTEPILAAYHDADDHGWQFIGSTGANMADAKLISLESIVKIDSSVLEVADLPPGWRAIRAAPGQPWSRELKPPEPEDE